MQEVFDFAQCADPERSVLWNIESKIDPTAPEQTKDVREFVERQHEVFEKSGYKGSIIVSKKLPEFCEISFISLCSIRALIGEH